MFADKNDRRSKFGKFRDKKPTKPESELDYKNVEYLARLVGPTGKIMSRRRTGFDGQNQRKLAAAIKVARFMGLLPYTGANPNDTRDQRDYREPRGRGRERPRGPREDSPSDSTPSTTAGATTKES
jgi:small subunit ribosomal protein S18